jgi:hypothetical protein
MRKQGNRRLPVFQYFVLLSVISLGGHLPLFSQQTVRPAGQVPQDFCISQVEMKLYRMINDYRRRFDLPAIPLSRSLCFVAATHVKDLYFNRPDQDPCNFHSWSDKGIWKPFCYPRDENKKNSVWDKPKEITTYKGKGYEIVYWENSTATIDSIMAFWKSVDYFKSFLMNTGKWQGKTWSAIGIGIYENYGCAWFGELPDPEGPPMVCGVKPEHKPADTSWKTQVPKAALEATAITKPGSKTKIKPDSASKPAMVKPERIDGPNTKLYIIVKSQIPLTEARKMLDGIKAKGFPDAKILQFGNKIRISVFESISKTEAEARLAEVKKIYKDAWMLKN